MAILDQDDGSNQDKPERPLRVLVRHSGSPKEAEPAEELLAHPRPLARFAGVDVWTEDRIRAGHEDEQPRVSGSPAQRTRGFSRAST